MHESFTVAAPQAVRIPDRQFSLADFAPAGDGMQDDTAAFTRAIAAVAAGGGGHLNVPSGRYLVGPIALVSQFDLHLERGATMLVTNDLESFPKSPSPFFNNDVRYTDAISAAFCHDVAITGDGAIDGQGAPWWKKYKKRKGPGPQPAQRYPHRPNLIVLTGCERVLVQGVTLVNSPNFHLIPQQCRDVTIDRVTITAPPDSPNTDGIDPSGLRIAITRCTISVGDDNIVFKPAIPATFPRDKLEPGRAACEDLLVADCHFGRGHGMSIGGQTPDGLKRLLVKHCTFEGTNVGIRMKADQGSGGLVEDCVYQDLTMKNVLTAVLITSYYPSVPKDPATMPSKKPDAKTPVWMNVVIRNVTATGCTDAGGLIGLAERRVQGVTFDGVRIDAKKPMRIIDADGVRFQNSAITLPDGKPGAVATRADVQGIQVGEWTGVIAPTQASGSPAGVEDSRPTSQP